MESKRVELVSALENNDFSAALTLVQELEQNNPKDAELKSHFGDIFLKMSNFKMAYEKYEEAMRIAPANPWIYTKLGATCVQMDKIQEALSHFKVALKFEPENDKFKGYYGWALWLCGRDQHKQDLKDEAFDYLISAKNSGIEMEIVNNALGEYYIDNATASWPKVRGENGPISYATKLEHLTIAQEKLNNASVLISDSNREAKIEYNEVYNLLQDLKKREFHGYPFVRNAGLIVGGILLLFGVTIPGLILLILGGLYYHSNLCPGYIANRKFVKGSYSREPFWVRRINEVGNIANSITVFSSSISGVLFWRWLIDFFAKLMQYMMAILLLPFLVVAGYVANYDLMSKIKQLQTQKAK